MKHYSRLLLPLVLCVLLLSCAWLSSCSGRGAYADAGCHILGHTDFKEYGMVYLTDMGRHRLDSLPIGEDGRFAFHRVDTLQAGAFALLVRLQSTSVPDDFLEMPVLVEEGSVRLEIGEYVHTSGTPLNLAVQEFLDNLQHCKDGVLMRTDISMEEVRSVFSDFYKQQILTNRSNSLGRYIYCEYGHHLSEADAEQVKAVLEN